MYLNLDIYTLMPVPYMVLYWEREGSRKASLGLEGGKGTMVVQFVPALSQHKNHNAPLYGKMPSMQQKRIGPTNYKFNNIWQCDYSSLSLFLYECFLVIKNSEYLEHNIEVFAATHTFSTTDVNLKVRYNPVVRDEKRLPYSLFKKNLYQTGVGRKARYSSRKYSSVVNI